MSRKKQATKQTSKKAAKNKAARGNEAAEKPTASNAEATLSQQRQCRENNDSTPTDSQLESEQSERTSPLAAEWRPRAELDRESIAIFLGLECGNPQAALSAVQRIDAAINRIRLLPDSGGRVRFDQLANKEYRTVLANPYTIYYRFDARAITIYRVLHQRRNMDDYALVDLAE